MSKHTHTQTHPNTINSITINVYMECGYDNIIEMTNNFKYFKSVLNSFSLVAATT